MKWVFTSENIGKESYARYFIIYKTHQSEIIFIQIIQKFKFVLKSQDVLENSATYLALCWKRHEVRNHFLVNMFFSLDNYEELRNDWKTIFQKIYTSKRLSPTMHGQRFSVAL